jgi:FKBP-type peptidyl-prolyl cis-trans isomerase 2
MERVKEGDTIVIHYTGKLEDGTVFDSSDGKHPLEFTVGEGEVVAGLEQGVIGMAPGETKTISIPAELAYGPRTEQRVCQLDKKRMPENFVPEIGQQLQMYRADGLPVMGTVIGISDTGYSMDFNHPLAGKTLVFETTVVEIAEGA